MGATDTVLVLFEDVNGVPRLLSGDDDSGEDRNAAIEYKLFSGRSYTARLRVYYPGQLGTTYSAFPPRALAVMLS